MNKFIIMSLLVLVGCDLNKLIAKHSIPLETINQPILEPKNQPWEPPTWFLTKPPAKKFRTIELGEPIPIGCWVSYRVFWCL